MSDQVYHCESCGGIMEFDSKSQTLKCPNCGTEIHIENNRKDIIEHSFTSRVAKTYSVQEKTSSTMECSGCGATIEIAKDATAAACPYCGSSYVMASKQAEAIIPDGVIPFKVDKNDATQAFGKWIKKLHFAPNSLKTLYERGDIQGRYIPFWTFDADCKGSYTGMGGKRRTEKYKDSDGNTKERTVTDWYFTSGRLDHFFDDVLVSGTENFKKSLINGMASYNVKDVVSYSPEYFSGYLSESYTVELDAAHKTAVSRMDSELRDMARRDILRKYDDSKDININVSYNNETFKHIMVPMYATSYHYKDKNYTVLINGQNKDVKGEYPKSPAKIAILIIAIIAVIAAIFGGVSFCGSKQSAMEIPSDTYSEVAYDCDYLEVTEPAEDALSTEVDEQNI